MAHYLPPPMMAFFRPPPPLPYKPPIEKRQMPEYMGVGSFLERAKGIVLPMPEKKETPKEIKARRKAKKLAKGEKQVKLHVDKWDPNDPEKKKTSDAYKTLFVSRLHYSLTEEDLKHEFEYYGPIKEVMIPKDTKGKSRGYAFVEFESSKDLKHAYRDADGRKISNRRIIVDVERGRTVKNWKPRRLGGGLGFTRLGPKDKNQKYSGRVRAESPGRGRSSHRSGGRSRGRSRDRRDSYRDRDRDSGRGRGRDSYRDRDSRRSYRSRDRSRDRSRRSSRRRSRSRSPRRR